MKYSASLLTGLFFVLSLVLLLTPSFLRVSLGNGSLIGEESYYYFDKIFESDAVLDSAFFEWFLYYADAGFLAKVLPLFLGGLCSALFFAILYEMKIDRRSAVLASFAFIFSGLFLSVFTRFTILALVLFLGMLSCYAFLKNKFLGYVVACLLLFVDSIAFAVVLFLLIGFSKDWREHAIAFVIGVLLVLLLANFNYFRSYPFFSTNHALFLLEFGDVFGYSLFVLFFAIIGAYVLFGKRNKDALLLGVVLVSMLFSYIYVVARVLLLPVLCFFAGTGIAYLLAKKWDVSFLKNSVFALIGVVFLFTSILSITYSFEDQPSTELIEALYFAKTSGKEDVILSSADNGIFIKSISKRNVLLDNVGRAESNVSDVLFYSYKLKDVHDVFLEQNITHVLVDEHMREGGIWAHEDQGLLFLLKNDPSFVLVFKKQEISLYKFADLS